MKLFILTILTSSFVSLVVSHWYLKQMTQRTEQFFNDFFKQMEDEYQKFLGELINKENDK